MFHKYNKGVSRFQKQSLKKCNLNFLNKQKVTILYKTVDWETNYRCFTSTNYESINCLKVGLFIIIKKLFINYLSFILFFTQVRHFYF